MSSSYTVSESTTFTLTHAKYLASKVRTDLMRIHRLYDGIPTIPRIDAYESEITALMHHGYLKRITYGFKKDGSYISPTVRYEASELVGAGIDDRPGKIPANEDVGGAGFGSFLTYSSKWYELSQDEQDKFEQSLSFQRAGREEPGVTGYYSNDKVYSAAGKAMNRSVVRSY